MNVWFDPVIVNLTIQPNLRVLRVNARKGGTRYEPLTNLKVQRRPKLENKNAS